MLTMTSLAAQSQFGSLIDASQRQPVTVTRHGRPVAVVLSYEDYIQRTQTIPFEVARLISERAPLRGPAAGAALSQHFADAPDRAAEAGLTEDDVSRLLNDK